MLMVLTNRPSETGIILPIDKVEFPKHAGTKGNEAVHNLPRRQSRSGNAARRL